MSSFRFPTIDELKNLEIFKKIGVRAALTDFAILSGAHPSSNCTGGSELSDRTGIYYTNFSDYEVPYGGIARRWHSVCINSKGLKETVADRDEIGNERDDIGVRLVISMADVDPSYVKEVNYGKYSDRVKIVEYGEYPQNSLPTNENTKVTNAFLNNELNDTEKLYSFYRDDEIDTTEEYEYNGKKYVYMPSGRHLIESPAFLSNGDKVGGGFETLFGGVPRFVEVKPVRWLVDEESNVMVSEKIMFSGVPYSKLDTFISDYFSKELLQNCEVKHNDVNFENIKKVKNISSDEMAEAYEILLEGYKKSSKAKK